MQPCSSCAQNISKFTMSAVLKSGYLEDDVLLATIQPHRYPTAEPLTHDARVPSAGRDFWGSPMTLLANFSTRLHDHWGGGGRADRELELVAKADSWPNERTLNKSDGTEATSSLKQSDIKTSSSHTQSKCTNNYHRLYTPLFHPSSRHSKTSPKSTPACISPFIFQHTLQSVLTTNTKPRLEWKP